MPSGSKAVVAIGSNTARRKLDRRFPSTRWATIVHPSAVVDPTATLGEGTVVMAGAVIQAGAKLGRHVVLNTLGSIDHDCTLGDYVSVAPGATVNGTVTIGERCWVGARSMVREGLSLGPGCVLGAGAVLVKDMPADETWVGVPALATNSRAHASASPKPSAYLGWMWPRPRFDEAAFMRHLQASLSSGQLTNHGPAAQALELAAARRLHVAKHAVVAVASGTAALHAMLATHVMCGGSATDGGILVSAFGFPPILQGNWSSLVRVTDIDPKYGGPILPSAGERPPAVICLVNPFGYRVDVAYYRRFCDRLGIPLWFDNASSPLTFMPDGGTLADVADMVTISLHETKAIGRGEGGLLLVPKEHEAVARRAINFGYDATLPAQQRTHHAAASNWRMSDFAAAAILSSWDVGFDVVLAFMYEHDDEIVDVGPFRRGLRGSIMTCLLEGRQPRPDMEVKHYYRPLATREQAPECWRLFDALQARPFHPLLECASPPV
jgi:sugar O-acyltransferase (sialic acid O-acetyltransferase NeuD family)